MKTQSQGKSSARPLQEVKARHGSPTDDQIRERAYEIFVDRGGAHGQDVEDWLRAEHELRAAGRDAASHLREQASSHA